MKTFLIFSLSVSVLMANFPNEAGLVLIDAPQGIQENAIPNWQESLQKAFEVAKDENKAVLLVIVGSRACPWSDKLLNDIVYKKEFLEGVSRDVVFCKMESSLVNPELLGKELPAIVLFSENKKEIFRVGYLPYSPALFAKKIVEGCQGFKRLQGKLQESGSSDRELESMYEEASEIGSIGLKEHILQIGMQKKKSLFFLLARYEKLLADGKKKEPEAKGIKDSILSLDPKNSKKALRKLALLEFEMDAKGSGSPKSVIKPLLSYLKVHGESDKDAWKMQMQIAQYLFSKNKVSQALTHTEMALKQAPEESLEEIRESIDYLKGYLNKKR